MDQAENEIEALQSAVQDGQLDSDKEEEIQALAAKRTKDVILSHCSYYDVLLPIMGNRPNNLPLASAKTPAPSTSKPPAPSPLSSIESTPSNTINLTPSNAINLTSGQLLPMEDSQSTQYSGSESTHSLIPILEMMDDFDIPDPDDPIGTNSHTQPPHRDQPEANETIKGNVHPQQSQRSPSCQFQTPGRNKVSSNLGPTPKTVSRRSSGSAAVLKSMKSSLPSPSDFQAMTQNAKETNDTNCLMLQETAGAHNTVIGLLGAKFGLQTASNKHSLEEEDPDELANKKAKRAKQDELDLIRLECKLAAERRAFEQEKNGSGSKMLPLDLMREKVDMVAKLTLAHVPVEQAQKMVEEILKGLDSV
ncbi:hypothetical protein DFH28DRAFT_1068974 [Melampsora americana]|nr:hypothetical protein DFH28DRAFT_1068974 [Melampsora americana]